MNAPDLSCSTLLLVDDEEANLDLLEGIGLRGVDEYSQRLPPLRAASPQTAKEITHADPRRF